MRRRGFTLIELLIVVAIIAILAAIAIPNFLEAQTRSKVAREKADLRSLALAHEAYRVDNNDWCIGPQDPPAPTWVDYIPANNPNWRVIDGNAVEFGQWFHLTTPIPYVTSVPRDAFHYKFNEQEIIWRDYYRMWNFTQKPDASQWGRVYSYKARLSGIQVLICGVGPDGVEDVSDGVQGDRPTVPGAAGMMFYDPTNGTISWGDVYYGLPGAGFDIFHMVQP